MFYCELFINEKSIKDDYSCLMLFFCYLVSYFLSGLFKTELCFPYPK